MKAPYTIYRPDEVAVIYDSPHSGRYYPPDFRMGAPMSDMRRGEDAYVDELLFPSVEVGALLLTNEYPRCYIDVNRAVSDIDPDQLSDSWPGPTPLEPTEKSRRGLGLIRRLVVPGVEAQAGRLAAADVARRIEAVYVPYHTALDLLVAEVRGTLPTVLHIDWHSMKSMGNAMTPDGPGASRPDFIVSDGEGTTAEPAITAEIVDQLRKRHYTVAVNDPYKGGTIVKRIGAPSRGIHSIQIEINRALYLDEAAVQPTARARRLAHDIWNFTRDISSVVRGRFSR